MNLRPILLLAALAFLPGTPGSAGAAAPPAAYSAPAAPAQVPVMTPAATIPGASAPGVSQSASGSALSGLPDVNLSWSGYFEALAILCFILALLWALLWLFRRRGNSGGLFNSATPGMRIENRLALGPKKWILVVRYLDRRLVLGVTDEHIRLLTELYDEDVPAQPQVRTGPAPAAARPDSASGFTRAPDTDGTPAGVNVFAGSGEPPAGDADLQRAFSSVFKSKSNSPE